MAKIQIKSEKITPFGGIFHVRELFSRTEGLDFVRFAFSAKNIGEARVLAKKQTPQASNDALGSTACTPQRGKNHGDSF